ncbi:TPA_asm: hypothetical protein GIH59_12665 [Listeria monocytogenes]|nr:hypothetical protein [Listeria monocytogenes]
MTKQPFMFTYEFILAICLATYGLLTGLFIWSHSHINKKKWQRLMNGYVIFHLGLVFIGLAYILKERTKK